MCGIGGIYYSDGRPVESDLLRGMADLIRYRGPDDQGFYQQAGIGLFHDRLSIIDLKTGHQPLTNEDGSLWIVFNGEIYNYLELRADLLKRGHVLSTQSDTEVILHLYEEYGTKCLDFLNGMFAFAIWDNKRQNLFLARDRMGIKPLYYFYDGQKLVFASEIKAILLHPEVATQLHYPGLIDYLTFQYTLGEKTLFQNIHKLLPGHYLLCDSRQCQKHKYWEIKTGQYEERSEEDWAERLKELLTDAVRLQLRSDVPVGAHLSGGIDSGSLVCLASRQLSGNLQTFSAGFAEGGVFHDLDFCQLTSKAAATRHRGILPTAADFAASLPLLAWHMDEPAAAEGIFPQYYVSRLAAANVKVVLGGQGGDEIFGGYTRYYLIYLEMALKQAIFGQKETLGLDLADLAPGLPQLKQYQPLMREYFKGQIFGNADQRYFDLIRRSDATLLLTPEVLQTANYSPYAEFQGIFNAPGQEIPLLDRILNYECRASLPALLQVEDRTSMAVSLESRVPFLDHRLVELAFKMPPRLKLAQGQLKAILKKAMRGIVPSEILDRPDKLGFPVPLQKWSQNELKTFIHDLLADGQLQKSGLFQTTAIQKYVSESTTFDRTLWGLLNLELWQRLFLHKEGFARFQPPKIYESRLNL